MVRTANRPPGPAAPRRWRGGVRERAAWLLRVNRLHAGDGDWVRAGRFAAAFPGGCWSGSISESTISRWETGSVRVPHAGVARYEQLLELPPGTLVSVLDTVNRYAAMAGTAGSDLSRLVPDDDRARRRLEALLDQACSSALMTGPLWDELTSLMAGLPQLRLVPSRAWDQLAGRLLDEMVIADWVAWMHRFEALNRLLNHPIGQTHAIDACAALAADPTSQVVVEVISALDATPHPDAGRQVLRQLAHPTSEAAGYGALLACVRKTRQRHLSPAHTRQLATLLAGLLADPDQAASVRPVAADILRNLPDGVPRAVRQRLAAAAAAVPTLGHVLDGGRLISAGVAEATSLRLAHLTMSALPRDPGQAVTAPLPVLIDELLFSPQPDTRLFTSMLLASTPYRSALATVVAGQLRAPDVLADPDQSHAVFSALRVLGGPVERRLVERLVTEPRLPSHVPVQAVYALGHIGGQSADEFWGRAISRHGAAWQQRGTVAAQVLEGLVYALGMARHDGLLSQVRQDEQAPAPARAAAAWWLNIPRQIAASARL